jgi:hypothetical protein
MEAYRIGVSIALANGISPVLAIIAKDNIRTRCARRHSTRSTER